MSTKNSDHYFLRGGGEMGELIRSKDWSKTSLGDPADWAQSLRTMVGVMLENPFGMYIAWGNEYTQLYNDSYRPILGSTKHPQALGIGTRETFSEIWHIIGSMFDGAMKGKAVGFSDLMLPMNRNGFMEECYFDFSYSPIRKDNGEVGGVLVTVIETTDKKKKENRLKESEERFRTMAEASDVLIAAGDETSNAIYFNRAWVNFTGRPMDDLLKFGWVDLVHPEDKERYVTTYLDAFKKKVVFNGEIRVLGKNGEYGCLLAQATPLFLPDGSFEGYICSCIDITDQKNAIRKIEERQRLYETITGNTPDLIYVFDLNHRFTYANEALLNMWGRTWDDSIGKGLLELGYEPWHAEMHEREIDQVIATKKPIRGEVSFPHASLGKRMYDYIFTPVINENGEVEAVTGTTRDISDIKIVEEKLKKSEEKFRLLADSMPQPVWTSDPHGNMNYFNQSIFEYSGLTPEQINNDGWLEIVHPEDREENIKQWLNSIKTGKDFLFEHRFRKRSGQYRWHLSRAMAQKDENGNIQNWVGTSTDIQEQKTFARDLEKKVITRTAELKDSEGKFYKLFNLSPITKTLSDASTGKIIMVNDAFTTLFGYSRKVTLGRSSAELGLLDLEEREIINNELKVNEKIENKEIRFTKKSGEKFTALASAEFITIGDRQFILSAFNDISVLKKAENNIKQKNMELERMNQELQSFAYISSHDLQEPLRKIQTFASRLKEKEESNLSDYGKDMYNRIQEAAKRMQTLIQDLIAYSSSKTNDEKIEITDLNEIIMKVKEDLKEELKEKHATIEAIELGEAAVIPFQFRQLMHNLIGNSLKYSNPENPPHIKIKSEVGKGIKFDNSKLLPQRKYCHITVSDNGIGFDQQYNEKIFEVFQRLHRKNEFTGTGIGLSIVKKIVENHQGIISAQGELNKGATFDIYIPAI